MRSIIIVGIATMYTTLEHDGQPLYCDCGQGLVYDVSAPPWIAVHAGYYQDGSVQCGDEIILYFLDGQVLEARALDAGPFGKFFIADHPDLPIVTDVPEHLAPFPGRSTEVRMINHSAAVRELERWVER